MVSSPRIKYSNAIFVTSQLLKVLSIKFSMTGLQQKLEDHPEYPSLLAISDCLTEWQIANEATQISKETLKEIPLPFVAHFSMNGGSFVLVNSICDGNINYSDEKHKNAQMPEIEFLQKWSGIILRAEGDQASGEPDYYKNIWKDLFHAIKFPAFIVLLFAGIGLMLNSSTIILTLPYYLVLLTNLLGIGVTSLLLISSIDTTNPFVQNLCSLGNKNGCNAILKTNAAKLTNWLSWSEVGFFYFTGSFLSLLLVPTSLPVLSLLNLLALPYSVYSIGYQYKHKNWCVLCCMVQGLLWLTYFALTLSGGEGMADVYRFSNPSSLNFVFFASIAFSFLFPIGTWYILKPLFSYSVQFKPLKQQLKKFKYNSELFNQVLINQPYYAIGDEIMPVVLGNPEAETIITMVSNPFCGPCGKAHQTIDEWLRYRDDLQLKIIFTTADHDDDEKTKVSRHISALTMLNNPNLIEQALNDWYAQGARKYETWAQKYPVKLNVEINDVTQRQKQWCVMAEIAFTPTILINGFKLPEPYTLEDIKYLIS